MNKRYIRVFISDFKKQKERPRNVVPRGIVEEFYFKRYF